MTFPEVESQQSSAVNQTRLKRQLADAQHELGTVRLRPRGVAQQRPLEEHERQEVLHLLDDDDVLPVVAVAGLGPLELLGQPAPEQDGTQRRDLVRLQPFAVQERAQRVPSEHRDSAGNSRPNLFRPRAGMDSTIWNRPPRGHVQG